VYNDIKKTFTETLIDEIDYEYNQLSEDIKYKFTDNVNKLKELLMVSKVKTNPVPDVVFFHKGDIGLNWRSKTDDSMFIFITCNGEIIHFQIVNKQYVYRIPTTLEDFIDIINKIKEEL